MSHQEKGESSENGKKREHKIYSLGLSRTFCKNQLKVGVHKFAKFFSEL